MIHLYKKYFDCKFLFLIFFFSLFSTGLHAGLKIYHIRHAEAGHNVVKEWENIPKSEWPAYVGNGDLLTPKGDIQKVEAAQNLQKFHFDFIATSPSLRARKTILPYFELMGVKSEIWPELNEYSSHAKQLFSDSLPTPLNPIFNKGAKIELTKEDSVYFTIRNDGQKTYKFTSKKEDVAAYSSEIKVVLKSIVDRILLKYGGSDKSVLLVSHGNIGKDLLRFLINDMMEKTDPIGNTKIWMVEQQTDGSFKLKMYNDIPVEVSKGK
jgi:broad specificity phosphatase PhoE